TTETSKLFLIGGIAGLHSLSSCTLMGEQCPVGRPRAPRSRVHLRPDEYSNPVSPYPIHSPCWVLARRFPSAKLKRSPHTFRRDAIATRSKVRIYSPCRRIR